MSMISDLQSKWRRLMEDVQRAHSDMLQQQLWSERLGRMIRENEKFVRCESPFIGEMARWYVSHAAMSVRRQVDADENVISLRRVLEQMNANPPALIGLSPLGKAVTVTEIDADIATLVSISQKIVRVADREIAHADRRGFGDDVSRPNFKELNECIDGFATLAQKYYELVTGAAMIGGLQPVEQFEWSDVFRFSWIPKCPECGHSAIFHSREGRMGICNGWTDDWKQAGMAGPAPDPCRCGLTDTQVYGRSLSPGT